MRPVAGSEGRPGRALAHYRTQFPHRSIAIAVFLATDWLWVAAPAIVVTAFCISSVGVGTQINLQASVDADVRGRIMSLYVVLFRAVPAIGALLMGAASESLGLKVPVAVGAVLTFGVFAWVRVRRRGKPGNE